MDDREDEPIGDVGTCRRGLQCEQTTATNERKRNNNSIQLYRYNKEKWRNGRNSEVRKIRRQYPFF